MSKGTILYVGGFELPDKNAAAHRVLSNGKIFRNLGYDVVFVDVDKQLNYKSCILNTFKKVQGFDCWSIPYPNSILKWAKYLTGISFIYNVEDKYKSIKLVVAYNYSSVGLFRLQRYCKKNNIKIAADCTEWYSTKGSNLIYKIIKGTDSFFRMRFLQKKLDCLIVISEYLKDYYKNSQNVMLIPPLVDINEKKWEIKNIRTSLKLNIDNKFRFVYAGSPGKNKDKLSSVIDALYILRKNDNYQMDIVGITIDQFEEDNPEYIDKLNFLGEKIVFFGRLSNEESLEKLKEADYSIFIREKSQLTMAGFPTKFVESISCGVPVITTDTSDVKFYYLKYNLGFLLKDSDLHSLVNLFKDILEHKVMVSKSAFGDNIGLFHYKNYEKQIKEVFLNIMT